MARSCQNWKEVSMNSAAGDNTNFMHNERYNVDNGRCAGDTSHGKPEVEIPSSSLAPNQNAHPGERRTGTNRSEGNLTYATFQPHNVHLVKGHSPGSRDPHAKCGGSWSMHEQMGRDASMRGEVKGNLATKGAAICEGAGEKRRGMMEMQLPSYSTKKSQSQPGSGELERDLTQRKTESMYDSEERLTTQLQGAQLIEWLVVTEGVPVQEVARLVLAPAEHYRGELVLLAGMTIGGNWGNVRAQCCKLQKQDAELMLMRLEQLRDDHRMLQQEREDEIMQQQQQMGSVQQEQKQSQRKPEHVQQNHERGETSYHPLQDINSDQHMTPLLPETVTDRADIVVARDEGKGKTDKPIQWQRCCATNPQ